MSQTPRKSKVFKLKNQFHGLPKEADVNLIEEIVPAIKEGEFLAEAVYVSVDPYVRGLISTINPGDTIFGSQVARIIESKSKDYPVGKHVVGEFGWQTLSIGKNEINKIGFPAPWIIPDIGNLPLSLALGVLGMPGNTAYFGETEVCKLKEGEVFVVTGAGGAVGSHVGQIAKLKGCKVIGIAGSDEKGRWITKDLGFDHFINYKTSNVAEKLAEYAPDGVDCFFDNVGGEISSTIIYQMKKFGRVCICGSISTYNNDSGDLPKAPEIQTPIKMKCVTMGAIRVLDYKDRWLEGINQNLQWIKEGKLKYRETITNGFENTFNAFVSMLQGGNIGKAIVKV
ncbi:prostaglandin reductase 1 [Agrilus planipennis]|uniref:Prostaglandin reductase 1 n=1 Tax=Agrilus planipennis TaxID=224129 RepID=A0A1W4WE09_AGRPL|nr:prostaglandin reductase 1 [Agrilus planipennis]XP_018318688.1 prostaglandin reductase 1 [Agrilus planipennis]